jgi:rod shape determining protein RodA
MLIDRRVISQFDYLLFGLALLIPVCGLVVLFSAGYDADRQVQLVSWLSPIPSEAFARQSVFLIMGLFALLVGTTIRPSILTRLAYPLYGLCVLLLIFVDLFGTIVNGSQRWLSLGGFSIQPSEPAKLATILVLARYFSRNPPRPGGYSFKEILIPGILFGAPAGLIMGQPDLGTALVVVFIGLGMLLFMGVRPKVLIMLAVPALIAIYPAWLSLHDYQRRRIEVLVNPELDPRGSGYHITQSKIAVGSGKIFGKGYMEGTQTQLEFLPEHTTDFVFSVLAEEWGFVGCFFVLSLYFTFILGILRVVARSRELFSGLMMLGIGMLFFTHTMINIGMVIGLLPVVGIPMPLFSHGGSALISTMFSIGLLLGADMRRFLFSRGGS